MGKLLFITQKVDKDDDVLGVYHRWIEVLAEKVDRMNVICLYRGRVDLPPNVLVYSLGKEDRNLELGTWNLELFWRLKYIVRFYGYVWRLRGNYDAVLVHMNPIYAVLGGLFWKLGGKKILFWYNHPLGNITARLGIALADKVFCTSPYSFSAKYKKTSLMPAGIDTDFFKPMPGISKNDKQILCLGRISPIKKIEYLIETAKILDSQGLDFKVLIIGSPASCEDKEYESSLKEISAALMSKGRIEFRSAVSHYKTPQIYNSSAVFVNLTPTGSFDKTILEAMACGSPVLVSNKVMEMILPEECGSRFMFKEKDPSDLAAKIVPYLGSTLADSNSFGELMRNLVLKNHSLAELAVKVSRSITD